MTGFVRGLLTWLSNLCRGRCSEVAKPKGGDGGIGEESPIRTASEDRLKRIHFASRIAGVLSELRLREGRVFSIRGGWGFGKSSLKFLIAEQLTASEGADWLDFNPWQWGEGDLLTRALFGQMSDCLGGTQSKEALARAAVLRRYGDLLTGAGKPLKKAGGSGGVVSTALTSSSVIVIASTIGFDVPAVVVAALATGLAIAAVVVSVLGRIMLYFGRDRSNEPLDKVRNELEVRLKNLKRPLVVFIDDIDRLEPEQIRLLLRQVKANANLPNIAFVLLFQPNIVERALDPIANGDGRAFLEKIVQVNFDLPAVPASVVHNNFYEKLDELARRYVTEENGFTEQRWANASIGCIQPFLRNLRDARRLISSIEVHLPLHLVDDVLEVNIIDFFLLEVLRVFEPSLYATLFREKDLLLLEGLSSLGNPSVFQKAVNTGVDKLLEVVPEQTREVALEVVKELFPSLGQAYMGMTHLPGLHKTFVVERRVCTPRFFPRYFELQMAAGEISERRFVDFLEATGRPDRLSDVIVALEADRMLPSLVSRLSESVNRLPVVNAAVLLPGLFEIAEKVRNVDGDIFSSPYMAAWTTINLFLKCIPKDERGKLVLEALRSTKGLSIGSMLIHLSDPAGRDTVHPALEPNTVEEMKVIWLELMRDRAANDDMLIDDPNIIVLLYRWRDYAGSVDEPHDWVDKAIQSDEGFVKIAAGMMRRGTTYSAGDRVATPHYSFDKSTVDNFIGIDVAKARCDAIKSSEFLEYEEVLRTLLYHLEIWLGLRERDPSDLSFVDSL